MGGAGKQPGKIHLSPPGPALPAEVHAIGPQMVHPASASADLRTNPKKQIPNHKIFKSSLIFFLTFRFYDLTLQRKVLLNENEIIQSQ
jgi:hypothetical protein